MSQLAQVQQPKPLTNGAEWWSLTIQPTGKDVCDAIIGDVVTPLAAQARSWGAQRWFHTRCMDPVHPFIQVRILGAPRVLDRLQSLMRALVDQAVPHLGELQTSEYREEPIPTRWESGPVSPRAESDLAKYGGADGLALAEEVFELSSDLAAWATSRFPKANSRSSLAALLLFDASYAMMRGPRSPVWADRRAISWDYYWDSHLRSCTAASGPQAAHMRNALTSQLAPRILPAHRLMAATASEPAVDNWRKRWSRAIDTYLYRADKVRASRSAQQLTVYQSRLMLNRLGISVRDEAGLGLYARSWSKEREADFLRMAP
ncbi:lantibiotic dehydratase C-terminal domain-containing protein [Arthrobacter sp. NPDC097144]|jgi:hypothetical protein|uniref:lantibiotic dehydratase C-terminal domain-containing protein n=1 Tax=Arthrobacter sp. NPDC097144 TaxID=3363946 RepID=UPI00381327FB